MPSQIMPTVNLMKLPDPAAQTAKYVNMMNATKQQEAAERQAVIAQEKLDLDKNEDVRREALQTATLTEKGQAAKDSNMKRLRNLSVVVLNTKDPTAREAAYQNLLGMIDETDKQLGTMLRQVAPVFDGDLLEAAVTNIDDHFKYKYSTPIASGAINDRTGQQTSVTLGGKYPRAEAVFEVEPEPTAAPAPRTPTAPPAQQQQTAPGPVPVGKYGETRVAPDGGQLDAFQQDHVRRMKEGLGMTDTPASFTRGGMGQMSPDMVPAILDSAMKTGVMAQIDLDQMLAMTPPQARQGIMDVIRSSNIALQADAPSLAASAMSQQQPMAPNPVGRQQSTYANLPAQPMPISNADLGGQPPMRNTMLQSQGRTPFIPRREALAPVPVDPQNERNKRPSAGEVYDTEMARARAARDAAEIAGPKPLTRLQEVKLRDNITKDYTSAQSTIDAMLDPKSGVVAAINAVRRLSQSQKEAVLGYTGYLPTVFASTRQADTALKNLEGKVTALGKGEASLNGAIGQMAVQEWRIVRDLIASLDFTNMEPADLDRQLDIIEATAMRAAAMAEDAYTNQYVEEFARYPGRFQLKKPGGTPTQAAPKAEAQIPRVRGNADYNKLKPGTLFIDPNGERRRKPK